MLQTTSNTSTLKRKSSPEKVLNPPKPISPPRMFVDFEPGKIVSQSLKIEPQHLRLSKLPPLYSLFQSRSFKSYPLEVHTKNINDFIQGGSRSLWLSSIKFLCEQASIPLIKEIIYNRSKTLEAKKIFRKKLKEYLVKKNREKKGEVSAKPPFLSSSKTPLDSSKHRSCMKAKEDIKKEERSTLEDMRCRVLVDLNKSNIELMRTAMLIFQLLLFLANTRNDYITEGLSKRASNLSVNILKNWKEYSSKRVVKKEFYVLLGKSFENKIKARILRAFGSLKTHKIRKIVRISQCQATLQFKIKKRLIASWKYLTELNNKSNPALTASKVAQSTNMFTLSVSNLKSPDYYQEIIPEEFLLRFSHIYNPSKIAECLTKVNNYFHQLQNIPPEFHIRKAFSLSKDFQGTSEKHAEIRDKFRTASIFYQKWKKIYCKKWIKKLVSKFSSVNICKRVFSAYSSSILTLKSGYSTLVTIHQTNTKRKVFAGFRKILSLKSLAYKSTGIIAQKYFNAWIKFIFYKANRLEKTYQSSLFYQKKILKKSFCALKKIYKLSLASVIFRLNSLKRNAIRGWKHKLDSKIMLRRVFTVSLNLWKERITSEFRSNSHMLAEIIKAWREVCERKGNTKKFRIKLLMAANFNKSKRKITSFFKWKRYFQRLKATKQLEKAFNRCKVKNIYNHWKTLKATERIKLIDFRSIVMKKLVFCAWKKILGKKNKSLKNKNKKNISKCSKIGTKKKVRFNLK